jgi:RND family efflux transporter MFP subunit
MQESSDSSSRDSSSSGTRKASPLGSAVKWLLLLAIAAIVAVVITRGINTRIRAASLLRQETSDLAEPSVSVIHPELGGMTNEVVLPGNIQAFTDSPVYARASGYLKKWYTDIGAQVKAGQVLAEIEAPELDEQVRQAKADLKQMQAAQAQAQANLQQGKANVDLARVTADRYKKLAAEGVVSRQDDDQYQAQYKAQTASVEALEKAVAAAESNVAASQANLARLQQLQDFKIVRAPFDGVITARNVDVGALINAGNGGPAQQLFHIGSAGKVRVYVNLPEAYSRSVVPGLEADLTLTEFPGRRFRGRVVRNAEAMDASTRTLLTEVDVDNSSGELRPGAYAEVHLKLPASSRSLILPVNALVFRSAGLQVGIVRDGKADLVPITLGKDYGNRVEVVSGISETDQVIVNPPDSLSSGTAVRVVTGDAPAQP